MVLGIAEAIVRKGEGRGNCNRSCESRDDIVLREVRVRRREDGNRADMRWWEACCNRRKQQSYVGMGWNKYLAEVNGGMSTIPN
jgi:hypothetical protein